MKDKKKKHPIGKSIKMHQQSTELEKSKSERQRVAKAIRRAKMEWEETVDAVRDMVFLTDIEGKVLRCNRALIERLQSTFSDIIGKKVSEIFYGNSRPDPRFISPSFTRSSHLEIHEIRFPAMEGWFQVSISPLKSPRGRPKGVAYHISDITEHKQTEEELRQSFKKSQRILEETLGALVAAIEIRDPYTANHQRRVAQLACAIAKEMGLSEKQIGGIYRAGLIHDIGKINVPAEILSKPGSLTKVEFAMIKTHPQVGYDILKTIEFPWPVAQIVLQHHERMDGSGYPRGSALDNILLEAKILSVADVVEAMSSRRPYRPAHGIEEALLEISRKEGTLYDPEVVHTCVKLFTGKGFKFR